MNHNNEDQIDGQPLLSWKIFYFLFLSSTPNFQSQFTLLEDDVNLGTKRGFLLEWKWSRKGKEVDKGDTCFSHFVKHVHGQCSNSVRHVFAQFEIRGLETLCLLMLLDF